MGDAVQKVLRPDQVANILSPADAAQRAAGLKITGSITRLEDVASLSAPRTLHDALRLDYDGTPFLPDDTSVYVLRTRLVQ
ncbi:MAG: hypothetical protein HGA44_08045, partial [Cellulomonadaceae bacterium]|nr:hypothetical protein [Cellulomonadaceae bacterium]